MNCHSHERRDEVWTVVSGSGQVLVDGVTRGVSAGDVIDLPVGWKHTVIAFELGAGNKNPPMVKKSSVSNI